MQERLIKLESMVEEDNVMLEELLGLATVEEVQSYLKNKGLEFTVEELDTIRVTLTKLLESKSGELSDEDLELVAGGAPAVRALDIFCELGAKAIDKILSLRW